MRIIILILALIGFQKMAFCRLIVCPTFHDMQYQSDIVVIARPIASITSTNFKSDSGWRRELDVQDVLTKFEVSNVFKGDKNLKTFTLHHFRANRKITDPTNGPHFVTFDSRLDSYYLLFLKQESDGQYVPVTGQMDPGITCIMELKRDSSFPESK